ncbi:MFS transporter [Novosphingobium sp. MW5]|nr:MFS transporter [Novosphingobium sp. MW5]
MSVTTEIVLPVEPSAASPDPKTRQLTVGVSGLYLALYLHYGFFAFIPLWLKATGATPAEIGFLLAIPLVLRILTVAPFSAWAGRNGWVRNAISITAVLSAALILLLLGKPDYAGRIVIVLAFSIAWDQLPVLADAYAVMTVRSHAVDFGRVRVWGSIAAVASSAAAGWVIGVTGIELLPALVAGLLLLPALTAPLLPSDRSMAALENKTEGSWRDLVGDRQLMSALVAGALVIASHGVIANFIAIQLSAQGISTGMIGTIQAVAISFEIFAFWFGAKLLGQRDPMILIRIAAAAAFARWCIMALNPGLPVVLAVQVLQGVTSTGAILGVMLVIAHRVPVRLSAAAQGFNAVLLGIALAVVTFGSGLLWSQGIAASYSAMAILALIGLLVAWPWTPAKHRPKVQE